MQTVLFSKVEQAFHAALAARDAGARVDLDSICQGDPALLAEVQTLLKHFDQADTGTSRADGSKVGFLDPEELHHSSARAMLEEWGTTAVGQRVGDFTLIEQIGRGAMGVVFLAEQDNPRRTVALKIIRRSVATSAMIKRFEREAQLLGRLNHSGIAQVFDAGVAQITVENGQRVPAPYIAMEHVDGPTILQYVREHGGDSKLVLGLVSQVCDAIQHAHQRGIIHRDLKPANILVATDQSGAPRVKVLDFGVARQADTDSDNALAETHLTLQGHFIGTPAYMSPEQMRSSEEVDVRSDVYALGAILYQLLSERVPIQTSDCSLAEAARRIAEAEPTRLGSIARDCRGDIETIVAKALQKDPARRYQSSAELCRDIHHHLAGELIEVRRDSLLYLMAKKAARYRNMFYVAAVLLLAGIITTIYARHQQLLEAQAEQEAQVAQNLAANTASRLASELTSVRIEEGRLLGQSNDLAGAEEMLWAEYFEHPDSAAANWALRELYWRTQCVRTFVADPSECRAVCIAGDGRTFVTAGSRGKIRTWSLLGATQTAEFDTGLTAIRSICCLASGKQIAVAGEGGACIIDLATGASRTLELGIQNASTIDCASTGLAVAVGGEDGIIRFVDPDTTKVIGSIPHAAVAVRAVRFDNACYHLAAIYANGEVKLWQLSLDPGAAVVTQLPPIEGHIGWMGSALCFSPDGTYLASGSSDRNVKIWRVADCGLEQKILTSNGPVRSISFSPDGQKMVVPGQWRTQIIDLASGVVTPLGDAGGFDGKFVGENTLLLAGADGRCRLWDFDRTPALIPSTASQIRDIASAVAGNEIRLASLQLDGTLRVLKSEARPMLQRQWQPMFSISVGDHSRAMAMNGDGELIVIGRSDGHVLTVRVNDAQVVQDVKAHDALVNVVRISPDGRSLVSAAADGSLRYSVRRPDGAGWDAKDARRLSGEIDGMQISPDGSVVATASKPTTLQFFSLPALAPLQELKLRSAPWKLAFSPDGKTLAAGMWDRSIQLFDTASISADVRPRVSLPGHSQLVTGECFDSTGRLMASVSNDGSVRLWDVSSSPILSGEEGIANRRRCLATLDVRRDDVLAVKFIPVPGGKDLLAAGYVDGTMRIWDLAMFDSCLAGHLEFQKDRHYLPSH